MPNLLHLDSSADRRGSRTREIGAQFANAWMARGADFTVTYRDLSADPLPHLPDASLHWAARLRLPDDAPPAEAEQLQAQLLAELMAADVLLVGAPLYNYSLPSSLKAWVDYIHVPGVTTSFDSDTQPMAGRPAVIVTSQGGSYEPGSPTEGWEHAVPVLEIVLGESLGMRTEVIITNLSLAGRVADLANDVERSEAGFAAAQRRAAQLALEVT